MSLVHSLAMVVSCGASLTVSLPKLSLVLTRFAHLNAKVVCLDYSNDLVMNNEEEE